ARQEPVTHPGYGWPAVSRWFLARREAEPIADELSAAPAIRVHPSSPRPDTGYRRERCLDRDILLLRALDLPPATAFPTASPA
ncbi:hypothetical protein, partial [Frankia sp. CiP3]|uniref:hypothetical protein n=1 Tax=Frankia sp. CiP3 TaxID=2880971 RepID=UPI001EF407F1